MGKIHILKTTFDFDYLIKGTVLRQALWGANTFPTRNRLPNSFLVRRLIPYSFLSFSIVFHKKLWWRLHFFLFICFYLTAIPVVIFRSRQDLVKVFLTNMWFDEEAIYSQVKGIDICINDDVWLTVAGLRNVGIPIGKNKAQFFKSCLRNPNNESRSYSVGGLAMTPRILEFIVIWLLTPRGFNHIVLIEEDLMMMYCLMGKIQVNWSIWLR